MTLHLWLAPWVGVAVSQIAVIATSVYLHRSLAHRSLAVHPIAGAMFRTVLWLTTGQSRREWVAVHRKHHAFTDREGDPHSPQLLGFWRVQLLNAYYYAREARKPETLRTFAPDDAFHELNLNVQRPLVVAGRTAFSRTTFYRHTTAGMFTKSFWQVKPW